MRMKKNLKKESDKLDELKANQQTRQREIEMSNDQQKDRLIEQIIVRTTKVIFVDLKRIKLTS
jgi:hypothetical protein